jgi:hypothetical protein
MGLGLLGISSGEVAMNMMKKIQKWSEYTGTSCQDMAEVPDLVRALLDYHQFNAVGMLEDWYDKMDEHILAEHREYADNASAQKD